MECIICMTGLVAPTGTTPVEKTKEASRIMDEHVAAAHTNYHKVPGLTMCYEPNI